MAEVRTHLEGTLRWVQASGSGSAWATASAPASGIFGYVQEGASYTSGQTITTIMNRGIPDHHKLASKEAITFSFTLLSTGYIPSPASGSGASVPMWHMELRESQPENGGTGIYTQFHGVAVNSVVMTENAAGNTFQVQGVALAMNGPTASGFLS